MKKPQKIIIDLEAGKVILEQGHTVTVCEEVSQLLYCLTNSSDDMKMSIDITIPLNKSSKEGVEEETINEAKHTAKTIRARSYNSGSRDLIGAVASGAIDFAVINGMFDEMLLNPGDHTIALDFINYDIEGYSLAVYDYKRELFKEAQKTRPLSEEQAEWLRKNKVRLLNSKRKLNI